MSFLPRVKVLVLYVALGLSPFFLSLIIMTQGSSACLRIKTTHSQLRNRCLVTVSQCSSASLSLIYLPIVSNSNTREFLAGSLVHVLPLAQVWERWRIWVYSIEPFPAFARGYLHDLNPWPPGHKAAVLPLRQKNMIVWDSDWKFQFQIHSKTVILFDHSSFGSVTR
jgi:hypothetical protein